MEIKKQPEHSHEQRGVFIAQLLGLKKRGPENRYATSWGDKTAEGLSRTIGRVICDDMPIKSNMKY